MRRPSSGTSFINACEAAPNRCGVIRISAHRLGQCLPPEILDELHAEAQTGTDSILVANAFSLLGEAGRRGSLALARAKAFDKGGDLDVRHAAFHAIGRLGTD